MDGHISVTNVLLAAIAVMLFIALISDEITF